MIKKMCLFVCLAAAPMLAACEDDQVVDNSAYPAVYPMAETDPVSTADDAADDIAIWINPVDASKSLIVGTNKKSGVALYDLSGNQVFFLESGRVNNVDLRQIDETIIIGSNRSLNTLDVYRLNTGAQSLTLAGQFPVGRDEPYGACMYDGGPDVGLVAFIAFKDGELRSWKIQSTPDGKVTAEPGPGTNVGAQAEGCVADDAKGTLFVGVEEVGIFAMDAKNPRFDQAFQIDTIGDVSNLVADVEGLTIYYGQDGKDYLLASSQGDNTFMVYDRLPPHTFRAKFRIADNMEAGIDGAQETDGIDATGLSLGGNLPQGVFVVQDGFNTQPAENQNFKLVDWREIAPLIPAP